MQTDKSLHEVNHYDDESFPVGMYIVTKDKIIPDGAGDTWTYTGMKNCSLRL